jgi:hypothetical protein
MSNKTEVEQFADGLRDVTRSLGKKRYWSLVRAEIAALAGNEARRQLALRAAATEVQRLSEPSARIELNGHSASSLLRDIAEAAEVEPPAFAGVEGRGPDDSVVSISPYLPEDALYAFAVRRPGQEAMFVDGYFYRTASGFLAELSQRRERGDPNSERMAKFVADAGRAANDARLPSLADAILARARKSAA